MITSSEQASINKYDLLFESRLTKTETELNHFEKRIDDFGKRIDEMAKDMRWLLITMISFGSAILGLMAKGFHWF